MRLRAAVFIYITLLIVPLPIAGTPPDGCSCDKDETYEDHDMVNYGPLKVSGVSGVAVEYVVGTPAPHACVLLFTERSHTLVAKTETEDVGRFTLTKIPHGRYRLVVKLYGFCAANVPLKVRSWAAGKRLVVHMEARGIDSCSYGALE